MKQPLPIWLLIYLQFTACLNCKNVTTLQDLSVEVEAITLVHCKLLPSEEQHEIFQNLTLKPVYWKEYKVKKTVDFVFFKKMGQTRPIFFFFWVFQTNSTIFTTNQCEKMACPSRIRCGIRTHDLSTMSRLPLPLDQGSRPCLFSLLGTCFMATKTLVYPYLIHRTRIFIA